MLIRRKECGAKERAFVTCCPFGRCQRYGARGVAEVAVRRFLSAVWGGRLRRRRRRRQRQSCRRSSNSESHFSFAFSSQSLPIPKPVLAAFCAAAPGPALSLLSLSFLSPRAHISREHRRPSASSATTSTRNSRTCCSESSDRPSVSGGDSECRGRDGRNCASSRSQSCCCRCCCGCGCSGQRQAADAEQPPACWLLPAAVAAPDVPAHRESVQEQQQYVRRGPSL